MRDPAGGCDDAAVTDPTRPSDLTRLPDESEEELAAEEELEAELEADLEEEDEAEEEAEEVEPPRDDVEAAAAELSASGMADQIAAGELEPAPAPMPPIRARKSDLRGATQVAAPTTAAPAETLPYVDDRVSKVWVILIALAFAALFFNALFLGQGGFLTATPSPSPSPNVTLSPSPDGSPTAPGESPSPVPS
jgi:hypothetical protein